MNIEKCLLTPEELLGCRGFETLLRVQAARAYSQALKDVREWIMSEGGNVFYQDFDKAFYDKKGELPK